MSAELLLELSSALKPRPSCEAFRAQREQLLEAVNQPFILLLQLHTAPQLLTARASTTQSSIQLTLHTGSTHTLKI